MASEQDTLANLPLLKDLTFREWHGFINGFYAGARWGSRQHDYDRENHYWRSGYLLGTGTRYAGLILLYYYLTKDDT